MELPRGQIPAPEIGRVEELRGMYRVVKNAQFGPHQLELETNRAGLAMYAITLVSCAAE